MPVGKRRRTQDVASDLANAIQARSHGRELASDSPQAQQEPLWPSQDTALPDALEEQPPRSAEPSQDYDSSEGSEVPATARPGAATHVLPDSEEQETMQLTRPGSGAQRVVFHLDSEEQDLQTQPDRAESPGQHIIHIQDSEDQNRLDQLREASLPEPSAAGEGSDQAAGGGEGIASEVAADGAAGHEEDTAQVQAAQEEAEYEASIAHLSVRAQRELRALRNPWHNDACVTPPNPLYTVPPLCRTTALYPDVSMQLDHLSSDFAGTWKSTQST